MRSAPVHPAALQARQGRFRGAVSDASVHKFGERWQFKGCVFCVFFVSLFKNESFRCGTVTDRAVQNERAHFLRLGGGDTFGAHGQDRGKLLFPPCLRQGGQVEFGRAVRHRGAVPVDPPKQMKNEKKMLALSLLLKFFFSVGSIAFTFAVE